MKMAPMRTVAAAWAVVTGVLCCCLDVRASGPVNVEVAAKVGAGTNPIGGGLPNPLGIGTGGRAGVAFQGIYAGVSAMYYFGQRGPIDIVNTDIIRGTISPHSFLYGLELGYGLRIAGIVELRAQVGVGDDLLGAGGTVTAASPYDNVIAFPQAIRSTHYVYWEPGFTVLVYLGEFYVGADVSALLLPSGPVVTAPGGGPYAVTTLPFSTAQALDGAATVHAQVGYRF